MLAINFETVYFSKGTHTHTDSKWQPKWVVKKKHLSYILGMLIATFSPRRSLMLRANVLQKQSNKQT